ncbi:MAG: hypothetical protein L3J93_04460 [Thermoplasmata archaeon]|nr:hypothetical protein [Thermoplasmata archaeon]
MSSARRTRPTRRCQSGRWHQRGRRGASDFVATLMILAITVVLAATVFLWVGTFPKPQTPLNDDFSAQLATNATNVVSISIQLLSGTSITATSIAQGYVHLASQKVPAAFPAKLTLASGLAGGTTWAPGQTWSMNLASYKLPFDDNITVLITGNNRLLLQKVIPGPPLLGTPYFTNAWIYPNPLSASTPFTVFCTVVASQGVLSMTVDLTQIPGQGASHAMTYNSANGVWSYTTTGGFTPAGGPKSIFITVIDHAGQQNVDILSLSAS